MGLPEYEYWMEDELSQEWGIPVERIRQYTGEDLMVRLPVEVIRKGGRCIARCPVLEDGEGNHARLVKQGHVTPRIGEGSTETAAIASLSERLSQVSRWGEDDRALIFEHRLDTDENGGVEFRIDRLDGDFMPVGTGVYEDAPLRQLVPKRDREKILLNRQIIGTRKREITKTRLVITRAEKERFERYHDISPVKLKLPRVSEIPAECGEFRICCAAYWHFKNDAERPTREEIKWWAEKHWTDYAPLPQDGKIGGALERIGTILNPNKKPGRPRKQGRKTAVAKK